MWIFIFGVIVVIILLILFGPKAIDNILNSLMGVFKKNNIPITKDYKLTLEDGQKIHFYFLDKIHGKGVTVLERGIIDALKELSIEPIVGMNLGTLIALVSIMMKQKMGASIEGDYLKNDCKVIKESLGYEPDIKLLYDLGKVFGYNLVNKD